MWESLSFSELSDFSKLVFVSLISHADDEGRGVAKAATVASMTFPNDENKRVADVKKALSEIALKMSVQLYSVNGREYYAMTNWLDYQTINKPTKSKFPPPPSVGVGGELPKSGELREDYGSATVGVREDYGTNIREKNISEINNLSNACETEETDFERSFKAFCEKWEIADDNYYSPLIADLDFDKLDKAYEESPQYLGDKKAAPWAHTLRGLVTHATSICEGQYKKSKPKSSVKETDETIIPGELRL